MIDDTSGNRGPKDRPRVGITIGDPAGIGPEVVLKAVADEEVSSGCLPVVIGNARLLAGTARKLRLQCGYEIVSTPDELARTSSSPVIFNLNNIEGLIEPGVESAVCGKAAAQYIETAVRLCHTGLLDAISTAPINKRAFYLAGYPFPGHTEFLAHLTSTNDFAMAYISSSLRIVLLTTHIPLAKAITLVEKSRIEKALRLIHRELKRWGIEQPCIAVAALNPHSAEGGLFGIEEASEIIPAIESCNSERDMNIRGPFSADTVFIRASKGEFDAVLSCYHDQGTIAIKCLSFGESVNVTLGLPLIRTSADHGTAFDIAGKGVADPSSLIAAIKLAADLSHRFAEPLPSQSSGSTWGLTP
jgi:4-hydroxythreonine-4-phosphate dehydrogenase